MRLPGRWVWVMLGGAVAVGVAMGLVAVAAAVESGVHAAGG